MIVCVPTPAVAGLNDVPVTPGPEKVPPAGEPVNVTTAALTHTAGYVPAFTTGKAFTVIVLVALTAGHEPGALVVSVSVTTPLKLAAGVYVTVAGFAVCAVLLNVPPPDVIDHAPVVAPPPTLEPAKVIGAGVADWQTALGPPAITVATFETFSAPLAALDGQPLAMVVITTL